MTDFLINPAFDIIYGDDNKRVMLKETRYGSVKLIGIREWTILKCYAENTLEHLSNSFQKEFIDKVITRGIEMNILVDKTTIVDTTEAKVGFLSNIQAKATQLNTGFIKLDFHGSFVLFKLFTLSLKGNNLFEKLNFKRVISLIICLFTTLLLTVCFNADKYNAIFFEVTKFITKPVSTFIISAFFVSMCLTLVHEFGHFIIYKSLGGKSNLIGVGLKFFAIPIFYVNTDSTYLWNSKWKKILVILGGTFADIIVMLCVATFIIIGHTTHPQLAFFCYMLLVSLSIKMFFNLNIFITGNDGYFLLSEMLNQTNFAKKLATNKNNFMQQLRSGNISKISLELWLSIMYLLISFIFKALSIFMMIWSLWYIYKISG